jgi:hypothetical protein
LIYRKHFDLFNPGCLIGIFGNYEVCPIVFDVIEALKRVIWNREPPS